MEFAFLIVLEATEKQSPLRTYVHNARASWDPEDPQNLKFFKFFQIFQISPQYTIMALAEFKEAKVLAEWLDNA